jgi:hypothetical protein
VNFFQKEVQVSALQLQEEVERQASFSALCHFFFPLSSSFACNFLSSKGQQSGSFLQQ